MSDPHRHVEAAMRWPSTMRWSAPGYAALPDMTPPPEFDASPLAERIAREQRDRDRDLGFGSVVGSQSRYRLLNRDGSFNVVREGLGPFETLAPYHAMLSISWVGFLAVVSA